MDKKAVAYIRVSDPRQLEGESPETQREKITQYAQVNKIEILEWFFDEGKSAKNAVREELQNMLTFALKYRGKIDHVLVYKMNRASRNLESYYTGIKAVLNSKGITIRSVTEQMIDDTKQGRFMEGLLVLLAQLDNDGKSEYTTDNMRSLAEQGYWQHPPVLGYRNYKIPNELGKPRPSLQPDAMAPKVTNVLERFSEGDITKAELARYATAIGLRTRYGKHIGEDSLHRMLKNPVYAGYISDSFTKGELVPGKHKALISATVFERNQAILYPKNSRKNEVHLQKNSVYPLKGFVLCINCRQPLYASAPKTGNGSHSPRYHCARESCKGIVKSVKAVTLHDDFIHLLHKITPSEGLLRLYKRILVAEANQELGRLNGRVKGLRNQLSDIDKTRVNTIRKFTEEALTLPEKNELIDALDAQKFAVVAELAELEAQQCIREADIELAINLMGNVDKQWAASDLDVRVRFQKILFPEGVVYDTDGHRFGTSQISPLYRYVGIKKDAEAPSESYLVAGAGLEPATSWL